MSASHEIRTIEEFRGVTAQPFGVVVVTDFATGNRMHHPTCRHVSEDNFTTKVIENANRNGQYFYFLRPEDALRETSAQWCGTCGGDAAA